MESLNVSRLLLKTNPYNLLLLAGPALFLTAVFIGRDSVVDIHVHDTMFVIAKWQVLAPLAGLMWLFWCLYRLAGNSLYSTLLSRIHVAAGFLTVLFFAFLLCFDDIAGSTKPEYFLYSANWRSFTHDNGRLRILACTLIAIIAGQVIFVVNVIAGVLKRSKPGT